MTINRRLFDVSLQPVQGTRFAPTGFADLGAALFDRPKGKKDWVSCLLVESAQSMANRLEATVWDDGTKAPIAAIGGLPYIVIVNADGDHLSSSREESHRLASAYVRAAAIDGQKGSEWLVDQLGLEKDKPLDYHQLALAVFRIDPLALIHGVFFAGKGAAEFPGQPKFTRVITGFIEAEDVRRAESGGVKKDIVSHTQADSGGDSSDGYGSIPFGRTEWTARSITASINIDLAQLRSYGLPAPAQQLLETLALLEVSLLLSEPLRLRTNCDLERASEGPIEDRSGSLLQTSESLEASVKDLIVECRNADLLGDRIEATWSPKK